MKLKRKYLLPLLLPVQIVTVKLLGLFPEWVENWYSKGFYVQISKAMRSLLAAVPFSVGDVIYGLLILLLLRWLWLQRKTWKTQWRDRLLDIAAGFSICYFCFHVLWAMNYYRVPLDEKLSIDRQYSNQDLMRLTKLLIQKSNAAQLAITGGKKRKVTVPYSRDEIFRRNLDGYQNLAHRYPDFAYEKLCVKPSLISTPLSYMGFAGYLNPFTGEAQVNDLMPLFNFPTIAAHEMAHQMGYASESEANFIGFMASINNNDPYLKYSGYTYALKYCLRSWALRDASTFEKLQPLVHPGILANYKESEVFWDQYESFVESGFKIFYDNFLKFNQQQDGLDSYSKFVDLLVNYTKTQKI